MFPKNLVFFQPWLTVRILHFHAITGLPHTHALCMTQDVVRYVKMWAGEKVLDDFLEGVSSFVFIGTASGECGTFLKPHLLASL